jgi:hypothetical protein
LSSLSSPSSSLSSPSSSPSSTSSSNSQYRVANQSGNKRKRRSDGLKEDKGKKAWMVKKKKKVQIIHECYDCKGCHEYNGCRNRI